MLDQFTVIQTNREILVDNAQSTIILINKWTIILISKYIYLFCKTKNEYQKVEWHFPFYPERDFDKFDHFAWY